MHKMFLEVDIYMCYVRMQYTVKFIYLFVYNSLVLALLKDKMSKIHFMQSRIVTLGHGRSYDSADGFAWAAQMRQL